MNADDRTPDEVVGECLAIVNRCSESTGSGRWSDGYRAAASDIRAGIEARFGGRIVEPWERELRDVEVEARTLSRVLGLLRREQAVSSSSVVRRAIGDLITAIDNGEAESSVEITRNVG